MYTMTNDFVVHAAVYTCERCGYTTLNSSNSKAHMRGVRCAGGRVIKERMALMRASTSALARARAKAKAHAQPRPVVVQKPPPDTMSDTMRRMIRDTETMRRLKNCDFTDIPCVLFDVSRGQLAPHRVRVENNHVMDTLPDGKKTKTTLNKFVKKTMYDAFDAVMTCDDLEDIRAELEHPEFEAPKGKMMSRLDAIQFFRDRLPSYHYALGSQAIEFINTTCENLKEWIIGLGTSQERSTHTDDNDIVSSMRTVLERNPSMIEKIIDDEIEMHSIPRVLIEAVSDRYDISVRGNIARETHVTTGTVTQMSRGRMEKKILVAAFDAIRTLEPVHPHITALQRRVRDPTFETTRKRATHASVADVIDAYRRKKHEFYMLGSEAMHFIYKCMMDLETTLTQ